jgi:hypothetical protein
LSETEEVSGGLREQHLCRERQLASGSWSVGGDAEKS